MTFSNPLKIFSNTLKLSLVTLSNTLVIAMNVLASEIPVTVSTNNNRLNVSETKMLTQMSLVNQLSDVNSKDWAFQALQSLIEEYNCIEGYPDSNYQGDQTLTRYEFASALATCLNQIKSLVPDNIVEQEDLITLQRLQSEFTTEVRTLRQRIKNLDISNSRLAAQQFSTTATLRGEAIFALVVARGGEKADDEDEQVDENIVFGSRLRLKFRSSFTGKDLLNVRLQARNIPGFDDATGTSMARLGFEGSNDNDIKLDTLQYIFPASEQLKVYINAQADSDSFISVLNPLFNSGGRGAISRFGRRNPIYRQMGNTGVGIDYQFSKFASLGVGYLAKNPDDPNSGLFNGSYGAIAQLTLKPSETLDLGLTYLRSYNNLKTGTGSELANDPFDRDADGVTGNSYGFEANYRINPHFSLGGWLGYTTTQAEDLPGKPEADIFNYGITLAFSRSWWRR